MATLQDNNITGYNGQDLLGVIVDRRPLVELVEEAIGALDGTRPRVVFACANPHSLVVAKSDPDFRLALNNATQVVADGVGVTLMARLADVAVGPRITGTDYFFAIMQRLEQRGGGRAFFFGSSQNVLALLTANVGKLFPRIHVTSYSPPYRPWSVDENREMVARINAANPDVLWVGMTAPKQEKWVAANLSVLSAPVIGSIGAVFDFIAGTHPRAPDWMCRAGIEWVYRLIREPRRMWKRNFVSTPKFVALVLLRHVLVRTNKR